MEEQIRARKQEASSVIEFATFIEEFPELFCSDSFIVRENDSREGVTRDRNVSVVSDFSLCSNFSRIGTDTVLYEEVLTRPMQHRVFIHLIPIEDQDKKEWYIKDEAREIITGPFSAIEMDLKSREKDIRHDSLIKSKYDDDFYSFTILAKRYLRRVLCSHVDLAEEKRQIVRRQTGAANYESSSWGRFSERIFTRMKSQSQVEIKSSETPEVVPGSKISYLMSLLLPFFKKQQK